MRSLFICIILVAANGSINSVTGQNSTNPTRQTGFFGLGKTYLIVIGLAAIIGLGGLGLLAYVAVVYFKKQKTSDDETETTYRHHTDLKTQEKQQNIEVKSKKADIAADYRQPSDLISTEVKPRSNYCTVEISTSSESNQQGLSKDELYKMYTRPKKHRKKKEQNKEEKDLYTQPYKEHHNKESGNGNAGNKKAFDDMYTLPNKKKRNDGEDSKEDMYTKSKKKKKNKGKKSPFYINDTELDTVKQKETSATSQPGSKDKSKADALMDNELYTYVESRK